MKLSTIMDVNDLVEEIENGYVRVVEQGELAVLVYTHKAQFKAHWTPVTTKTRGLVVSSVGGVKNALFSGNSESINVIARGMPKFFTIEQLESGWGLFDDDENVVVEETLQGLNDSTATAYEKIDGSFVGVTILDGEIVTFTKGSLTSDEAKDAYRLITTQPNVESFVRNFIENNKEIGMTPVFEIVYKDKRHPVGYGFDGLYFLGAVINRNGIWVPSELYSDVARFYDVKIPNVQVKDKSFSEVLAMPDPGVGEGVVIVTYDKSGKQRLFKMKWDSFYALRREFYKKEITAKDFRSHWKLEEIVSWSKPEDIIVPDRLYVSSFDVWEVIQRVRQEAEREFAEWEHLLREVEGLSPAEVAQFIKSCVRSSDMTLHESVGFATLRGEDFYAPYIKAFISGK